MGLLNAIKSANIKLLNVINDTIKYDKCDKICEYTMRIYNAIKSANIKWDKSDFIDANIKMRINDIRQINGNIKCDKWEYKMGLLNAIIKCDKI